MKSTVAERVAAVRELERRLEALNVRAPIAGAVAACHHDVGVRVSAGEALMRLISSGDLWVRFAVPSAESDWLALERVVRVGTEDAPEVGTARIRRVAPEVDPATDMVFVEASLDVPAGAEASPRAGEIVRVRPSE
jgi:multidrug efflux pump subunit AcrA (membrane-fusion protein)